ncbi:hypothetical protein HanIR_Chr04g0182851 [Helianthus annuus]|nr:hypothetical protein HanIR_Chr04g0182851 [Helianthus annuus]
MFFLRLLFQKQWHGWNRGTMWSRVLSGVRYLEVLVYLLPLCNEDTGPVTPALIFRGVTDWYQSYRFQRIRFLYRYLGSNLTFLCGLRLLRLEHIQNA